MIFNYIRVSTIEQNTERQLRDVVCDRVYEEKISGKDTNRPQLQAMLSNIRSGDIINIHEMSRLARNTRDLLNLVEEITSKGATIIFHKENITFKGNENKNLIKNDDDYAWSRSRVGTQFNIGTPTRGNCSC